MGFRRRHIVLALCSLGFSIVSAAARAQDAPHDHSQMNMPPATGWQFMQDGIVFAEFNHQGGPRGGDEFVVPNWWMGMASRPFSRGRLTLTGMLSLDPATVGKAGYREIFQSGEALNGEPLVDRQHPHDLFMQLEAGWRVPISKTELSISGGPVGSPAFGPTPFMHRPSASENPVAPLTHHTFDSTHIAMGTVTAGLRLGTVTVEGSVFHGREPDEHRYNLDTGALDSSSGRVTWRPGGGLEFQFSRGYLYQPELLEPGNQRRTNGSVSWLHTRQNHAFTAVTVMAGRVTRTYSWSGSLLAEATHWMGNQAVYGRYEGLAIESEHLMFPKLVHPPHPGEFIDSLHAFTVGGVRRIMASRGVDLGVGGDATFYRVPPRLKPTHGDNPMSAHVFLRIRPLRNAPAEHHH